MREVCPSLIQYLNKKYDNLLDFRYVLVTGGTGACFYDQILQHYEEANLLDKDHLLLTNGDLNGKSHTIEYAIAIGACKVLKGIAH